MRRMLGGIIAGLALLALPAAAGAEIRAGAATVDASWHVGASAGQYASDGTFVEPAEGTYDPTVHSYRRRASYGIQSRLQARALVVEGPDGQRVALVKNDLYIPQDLLWRRTALLLEQGDSGIGRANLTMAVSHDHSTPFYSSTSWGVWAFQDVFDIRFYDYYARRMAAAVELAAADLRPVRVGASVSSFDLTHRHSFGPAVADDGTPAGYPDSDADHDLTVVRFDDVSDPANPRPLANLVSYSLHPEFLEGNDLISADYVGPLQKMADDATGATTIYVQNAVGTAEPERSTYHSIHQRLEFSHKDYAQSEYAARLMADAIADTWRDVADGSPGVPGNHVPFATDGEVEMLDRWYPGPFSHPYPGVSNCRTDKGLAGDPQLPVVGLPTCQGVQSGLEALSNELGLPDPPHAPIPAIDPGLSTDDFQSRGIPVPENYSAPAYTGLQEDIDVHLQAFRIGDILFTVCSCEQWADQSRNIKTRTDRTTGNQYNGYDWGAQCTDNGDGTWTCPNPGSPSTALPPVPDERYRRMRAQVNNPANGWNDAANAATAESEPVDPSLIKGNYTHDDSAANAALGYGLTVPISMANDYNGYIATYREYQRGDHYRKALTGWGPHSSDYIATRLVTMGRLLQDATHTLPIDQQEEGVLVAKALADTALNDARATALGEVGGAAIAAYEAGLPDDGGEADVLARPEDVERFGAAFVTWNGGSNFTDNPFVRVERRVDGAWVPYADQSGAVPVTLRFPAGEDTASYLAGDQEWEWTAAFEAFAAPFATQEGTRATPAGVYRFVIDGMRREDGVARPYHLEAGPFRVEPWSGITVEDFRLEPNGTLSFRVGPSSTYQVGGEESEVDVVGAGPPISATVGPIDYPDTYESPARFIRHRRTAYRDAAAPGDPSALEWFCFTCSFRPWLDAGDAATAAVTIRDDDGSVRTVAAHREGDRWATGEVLGLGEHAFVARGGVVDEFGNFNGRASDELYLGPRPGVRPRSRAARVRARARAA
jgi:hypothetical protein